LSLEQKGLEPKKKKTLPLDNGENDCSIIHNSCLCYFWLSMSLFLIDHNLNDSESRYFEHFLSQQKMKDEWTSEHYFFIAGSNSLKVEQNILIK
jgi:hypothetical protein